MGVGDLSYAAVASLKSIDSWIAVLNSNMAGAGRIGYKASRIKFGGGTVSQGRPTVSPLLGVNYAEQTLGTMQTTIDYSQAAVAASTDFTHLAIQRTSADPGMFVLSNDAAPVDGTSEFYYTFDGEFHFDTLGRLVNSDGLFVMSNDANGDGTAGDLGVITQAAHVTNDALELDKVAIAVINNPQLTLQFSRFGSGIFERITQLNESPVVDNLLATMDALGNYNNANAGAIGNGRVIPNALETSNASLTQSVPELALAQKMYAAIAKVIQVGLANIDVALGLGPR
ncbi:MAG: hypothetical protein CVV27_00340 [Candidatus Melainabacteria bacterium HGW-Melainabacteria-1]|nr:MAG: hypothetical protein CVV27_00340 [Candidatus Melainabacteria bacterium HGW-Melainabacteria-1]